LNTPADIERARAAKSVAKDELAGIPGIVGIGLAKIGDGYGIKVNLSGKLPAGVKVPNLIAGVPVTVEIVGTIRKRTDREDRPGR
jgi:hypothetical protein